MSWICHYASSSIGRKQILAKTGLLLCGFLLVHLAGNFLLFVGAEAFNSYAYAITKNKPILYVAEVILFGIFATHIFLALKLTFENRKARGGVPYAINAQAGEMTIATKTMPYTGVWTLIFLVLHLWNFKYGGAERVTVDGVEMLDLYTLVQLHFQRPFWSLYYIVSMALLAAHVHHGLQSALQTYGVNHPKWGGIIKLVANVYATIIFLGFSSFPVYFLICKG
jgi:succinate dehydrogenase / fumarate reductase, cytochrome b subunit